MRLFSALMFAAALFCGTARAEVTAAAPGAALISGEVELSTSPDRAWRALTQIERWWSSQHTYSGDARRLSLDPRAGGCWCERWGRGQSVEHGRVVLVMERDGVRTLRANAALGPLQELGVSGVLTFTISPHASGAKVTLTYRLAGEPGLNLEQLAPFVDTVLMEQLERFRRYSETGAPD